MIYHLSTFLVSAVLSKTALTHTQRKKTRNIQNKTKFCLVAAKEEESKGTQIINTCDYREKGLTVETVGNGEGKLGAMFNSLQ